MSVNWSKGNDLAQRAGGEMLDITGETAAFKGALTEWLATNFIPDLHIPAWLQEAETPRIFDGQEILAVTVTDRRRRFWFGGIPL